MIGKRLLLILVGFSVLTISAGCNDWASKVETAVPTVAIESLPATQTSLPPTARQPLFPPTVTPQSLSTAVSESNESQIDLLALKATPTQSPSATPTPDPDAILITDDPIFVGGDVRLQGWSSDGRFLAYFEYTEEQIAQSPVSDLPGTAQGTFTFYDTVTGQKCQRYSLDGRFSHEGPGYGQRFTWLPNGDLLICTDDGQAIQADPPCGQEENLTALFPEPIQSIGYFLNDQLLLLTGVTAYWLYNVESQAIYPIAEITPDPFNNLVQSPGGTYIGVTLAGNYTGFRSPIGGTRVVEVATGQIIARYDWEPANALDGTFGGPIWLNENEMVITFSLDQGPFFMTVAGEVRPLLALFDLEFEGEPHLPYADVYVEPETGQYHILLEDWGWSEEKIPPQVYHSDTGLVEILEILEGDVFLMPGGIMENPREDSTYLIRSIADAGASWVRPLACAPPWRIPTSPYFAHAQDGNRVDIFTWPECERKAAMQLGWATDEASYLNAGLSPDYRWLTVVPVDKRGRGRALFVIPLPELEG